MYACRAAPRQTLGLLSSHTDKTPGCFRPKISMCPVVVLIVPVQAENGTGNWSGKPPNVTDVRFLKVLFGGFFESIKPAINPHSMPCSGEWPLKSLSLKCFLNFVPSGLRHLNSWLLLEYWKNFKLLVICFLETFTVGPPTSVDEHDRLATSCPLYLIEKTLLLPSVM